MKNRITPILVIIIIALSLQISYGQDANNNYKGEKSKFFKLYKEYKNNISKNINTVKPIDPSGLFYIDDNNNFRSRTENGAINETDSRQPGQNQTDAVSGYTWAQTSGTYTDIAGTLLGTASNDDDIFSAIPIGFTFTYNGIAYTTVGISTNGYLKFGAAPTNTYSNVLSAQTTIYAGFNCDLIGSGSVSSMQYLTSGSAPNRVFTVQWTKYGLYNAGYDGSLISMQMVLNESTNKIQTIFGGMTIVTTGYSPQCGINGSATSDFNCRTTATDWSATTAGGTNTSNCVLTNAIKPAVGQTWTWGPPPLCGTYTIPGSYATVAAAISDLNSLGVCGTSPVIFNITPGYTETIPAGGYTINITGGQPTAAGPVIFQRNGAGTNPLLSSDVLGSGLISGTSVGVNGDAFVRIVGTDYISFKNINLTEVYTGAVAIPRMEYGFLFVRGSTTDGCKNDTLSGCVINMQRINLICCGISSLNINAAGTTTSPTTTDGRHENINVQGCTVNNSLVGMYFLGGSAVSPYDLYDHSFKIGTVTGNTLSNIGSVGAVNTATHYGIYSIYHDSLRILNNTINVNTGLNNVTHYGIFTSTGTNSSIDITNNTVCDTADGTLVSSSQQAAIYNSFGSTGTDNVVNITNNTVRWCRYFNAGAPTCYYIANIGSAFNVNITGNTVDSNTVGGQSFATSTGTQYGIYYSASNVDPNSVTNISGNTVRNLTRTQSLLAAGTNYGMYLSTGGRTYNVFNNTVNDLYNSTTTGTLAGIYCFPTVTTLNVYGNTVRDLRKLEGATSAPIYCLYWSQSTPIQNCYNNQVYNINNYSTTATGVIYGIYNFGSPPNVGGYESNYGNTIHDITHQGTTASTGLFFVGIYDGAGTTGGCDKTIHDNTIYNVTTNYGQTGGIYLNYADTAYVYNNRIYNIHNTTGIGNTPQVYGMLMTNTILTSVYNVYNNYISELYADVSPTFPSVMGIWQNNTSAGKYYYNTIYLDGTSSGINYGTIALYLAGATTDADLRDNIIINKSTYTGTGGTIALYRAESGLTYYNPLSNNNNLYAGDSTLTGNVLYVDGVNQISSITAYKTLMAPRDNASFSENSPFLNTATHPYNLHMSTVIPTYCESGGTPITSPFAITTDYDGNTRNVSTPDVGADEFAGIVPPPPIAIIDLKVIPGGFYNTGTGRLSMRDTIKVYLVDSVTCLKVDSAKGVLDSVNFNTNVSFSNANTGNYYMLVYHRNHLAVASRYKTVVTRGATVSYDFTTDSTKAYGFNMVKVSASPVRWAMIPADANRDGFVDGLDQTLWLAQNGFDGYLQSDFNGDNFVDGLDQTVWLTYNGNSSFLPCGFTLDPVTNQIIINTSGYDAKKSNKIIFDRKKQEIPVENNTKQNNNRK